MTEELRFALEIAEEAGRLVLRYFQEDTPVERKADDSPVTQADREAETLIRDRLEKRFPSHSFLGEETGRRDTGSELEWVVDPIDGTKSFIYGVPLFGGLIGLRRAGEPVLGVAHFPALGDTFWAETGLGAFRNGERIRVSKVARLEDALIVCGSHAAFIERRRVRGMNRLARRAFASRTWGDAYGYCMLAEGRAEIMLDPVANPWDLCAPMPIVKEAGGTFTDFGGRDGHEWGEAVATNGLLLQDVVEAYRR
ncbi:MAG: histidinol-phosphatase [Armatimonadetes bacterium]|nr:histidinol-phosphatase [Armatimonadota bacterium]